MLPSTVYCDNCGAANRPQARFCIACGQTMPTGSTLPPSIQVGAVVSSTLPSGLAVSTPSSSSPTGQLTLHSLLKQRFRILGQIGQGGMGAVYKAADTQLGDRLVAVKEMSQSGLKNQQEIIEASQAFRSEALMLAGLPHHPNLPSIYDHFDDSGRWYLVMDFITGQTLDDYLANDGEGRLPVEEVLDIGIQLCTVLGYLHQHQPPIIFRDLKPANIMRTADGHLYLIDFGIARHFKPGQAKDTVAYGSTGYAAPEQYGKTQTTPQSDIYSLGALLHQLLSGDDPSQTPFRFARLSGLPVPAALGALITRMVDIDADKRPTSMAIVKQELQRLVAQPNASQLVVKTPAPIVVSKRGDGHYTSIAEAIRNARVNDHILVRQGTYLEGLMLDRYVEIVGDGPREQIILESSDTNCILMQADAALVQGLTLRCRTRLKYKEYFAIDIPRGQLTLSDCEITSDSLACVAIHGLTANPVIQNCKIHGGKESGVIVYESGLGTLEDCDIFANALAGVQISEGGDPVIRNCKIHNGKESGVLVDQNGQGVLEDCDIFANALAGVEIRDAGNPVIRGCQIHDGKANGVFVYEYGQGILEDCDIFANANAGVEIADEGDPVIQRCRINLNEHEAIWVHEKGRGTIENCDLTGNKLGALKISFGSRVRRSGNKE